MDCALARAALVSGWPPCGCKHFHDECSAESCCLPGDITITKIPTGYLIGGAAERKGPGPWWHYVAIVSTFEEAARHARTLTNLGGVKAWIHEGGDDYAPLEPVNSAG